MILANPWKILEKNEPFTCPFFTVRSDLVSHRGATGRYNSVRMKVFGVAVLPIDGEGYTTLVGQYRYVLDRYSWELPGGGAALDRPAVDSAASELSEETGYTADHWLQIVETAVAPGTIDEITRGFVAWGLHAGEPHADAEEQLSLRRVSFDDAVSMALAGDIGHVTSVATILSLQTKLARRELPLALARVLAGC